MNLYEEEALDRLTGDMTADDENVVIFSLGRFIRSQFHQHHFKCDSTKSKTVLEMRIKVSA